MIYLSYFRCPLLKKFPLERQIAISRGVPSYYKGPRFLGLAPTYEMLKMTKEEYYFRYDIILGRLNCDELAVKFQDCVLLCWESDLNHCHRTYVGKWFQSAGHEARELSEGGVVSAQQALSL